LEKNMKRFLPFLCISIIVCFLFWLPYYIFQGKLFVGGDDTRLQYVFPWEYLQHMAFFSWNNISSVSYYVPNQFSIPFLLVWILLENIFQSKVTVDYIAFSLPLAVGFSYFYLFIRKLLPHVSSKIAITGGLFFIFSPIILQTQVSVFLTSIWLISIIPILGYYLINYLQSRNIVYVLFASVWCCFLSLGMYAIPWIFALLLPLCIGLLFSSLFFRKKDITIFLKDTAFFFGGVLITQTFWIIPFVTTFFGGGNNLGTKALSVSVGATFRSTVLATAIGNTWYPLLNLFHRQIIEIFEWQTKNVFENFYDKISIINIVYIAVLIAPLFIITKKVENSTKRMYFIFFFIFLLTLYFFTVNIGPFREMFMLGGYVPGFVMFRNFYDKFAIAYVFFYAVIICYSIHITSLKYPKSINYIVTLLVSIVLLNALPIKDIVNSPLWTTHKSYRVISFPTEYVHFLSQVKTMVPTSTNILSLPINIAAYTVVKEDGTNNVYAGTSPIKILTGINDYSGDLSFSSGTAGQINVDLQNKDYKDFNRLLEEYNTSYILATKNIPPEVEKSYIFAAGLKLKNQTNEFISAISGSPVIVSEKGNYVLYAANQETSILSLNSGKITSEKISSVEYVIHLSHISGTSLLTFYDSFHNGWGLFPVKQTSLNCQEKKPVQRSTVSECPNSTIPFSFSDVSFLWSKQLFTSSHRPIGEFGQSWNIDTELLKQDFPNRITHNSDGSINATFILYFRPQVYFYIGSLITICAFCVLIFLAAKANRKHE